MQLRKWNEKKREYEPYTVPDEWKVMTYSDDMDEKCNCAECGKEFAFGLGFTSLCIHTPRCGFGYIVCPECHEKELTL